VKLTPIRSAEALESFIKYCREHPEERFWQALRNWSRCDFILGSYEHPYENRFEPVDTFYIEGLNGTRE